MTSVYTVVYRPRNDTAVILKLDARLAIILLRLLEPVLLPVPLPALLPIRDLSRLEKQFVLPAYLKLIDQA